MDLSGWECYGNLIQDVGPYWKVAMNEGYLTWEHHMSSIIEKDENDKKRDQFW